MLHRMYFLLLLTYTVCLLCVTDAGLRLLDTNSEDGSLGSMAVLCSCSVTNTEIEQVATGQFPRGCQADESGDTVLACLGSDDWLGHNSCVKNRV